jgi:Protein of unknown function (DUF3429)
MNLEDTAHSLGYGGLIPFVVLALVSTETIALPGLTAVDALAGLIAYGAIIVSFMAALHWAHGLFAPWSEPKVAPKVLFWSVIPALAAWVAIWQLPARSALIALAVTLGAILYVDHCIRSEQWFPGWFWKLRVKLTSVAAASLLFAAFA